MYIMTLASSQCVENNKDSQVEKRIAFKAKRSEFESRQPQADEQKRRVDALHCHKECKRAREHRPLTSVLKRAQADTIAR